MELKGKTKGIEWRLVTKRTPNGRHTAHVQAGTRKAVSEDRNTPEDAQEEGQRMVADMLEELEKLRDAD